MPDGRLQLVPVVLHHRQFGCTGSEESSTCGSFCFDGHWSCHYQSSCVAGKQTDRQQTHRQTALEASYSLVDGFKVEGDRKGSLTDWLTHSLKSLMHALTQSSEWFYLWCSLGASSWREASDWAKAGKEEDFGSYKWIDRLEVQLKPTLLIWPMPMLNAIVGLGWVGLPANFFPLLLLLPP